jgi:threonine/homoserine/homoserine lactone efflux protein
LLGIANPKAWVAIGAVFASTHLATSATADAAAKIAVLAPMIVLINATWLVAGASFAPLLRDPLRARMINTGLAVVLVVSAAVAVLS